MTCDERKDLLLMYAADAVDDAERRELEAHLASGCPACAGALSEAQTTLANLPLALERVAPPAGARDRIMQRVLADASSPAAQPMRRPGSGGWLAMAAAAAILVFVVGMTLRAITGNFQRQLSAVEATNRDLQDALARREVTNRELQDAVNLRDATVEQLRTVAAANQRAADVLQARDLQLVSLGKQDPQPSARGRIIWDRDRNEWHIQVFDMKPPPPGRTFELWFITPDQKKHPAGTFDVDEKGTGRHYVKVPGDLGPIALAAITDEPIGGAPQPTGSIQLVGAIQ